MAKARFRLYNAIHGESIALVEMEEELVDPKAGIVDPETLTLRPIRNGGAYTLAPVDDHTVATLLLVHAAYAAVTEKPSPLLTAYMSRIDALIKCVGQVFDKVEYIVVESAADMDKLINPPREEYKPKTVQYHILGDILYEAIEKARESSPEASEEEEPSEPAESA
jgi:hypothetical protein